MFQVEQKKDLARTHFISIRMDFSLLWTPEKIPRSDLAVKTMALIKQLL